MIIFGDYHTHTIHSDGKSTLEENVQSAVNKGLKQIAITDHSFSHMAHGITKKNYQKQSEIISSIKDKYDIEILHGVESNLMGLDGKIDVSKEDRKDMDILVVGYHLTYKPYSVKNFFNFWLPSILKWNTKKRVQLNTNAYIKAIEGNDVDIIAHLNFRIKVNPVEIAKVAKEHETYIELNAKHIDELSDEQLLGMVKTGVKFIISSDAHLCKHIAKPNRVFAMIERLNIPKEQIVNINDVPKFKNYNLDKKY